MKCPNCNADNVADARFCGNCGTRLPLYYDKTANTNSSNTTPDILAALEQELINLPLSQPWGTSILHNPNAVRDGDKYTLYDERCNMELTQFIRDKTFDLFIEPEKAYQRLMPVTSSVLDFSRTLTQWHNFFTSLGLEMKDNITKVECSHGVILTGIMWFGSPKSPIAFALTFGGILENEPRGVNFCYLINNRINRIF